jgi:alkylhydroperoxidase family enzyme
MHDCPRRSSGARSSRSPTRSSTAPPTSAAASASCWPSRRGPLVPPRDQTLVAFARRLTLAPRAAAETVADLRAHLSDDAIAVVGLLNFANRSALATGITPADDLS